MRLFLPAVTVLEDFVTFWMAFHRSWWQFRHLFSSFLVTSWAGCSLQWLHVKTMEMEGSGCDHLHVFPPPPCCHPCSSVISTSPVAISTFIFSLLPWSLVPAVALLCFMPSSLFVYSFISVRQDPGQEAEVGNSQIQSQLGLHHDFMVITNKAAMKFCVWKFV